MDFIVKKMFRFFLFLSLMCVISCIPNFFHTIPSIPQIGDVITENQTPIISASFTDTNRITGQVIFGITNGRIEKLIFSNFNYTRSNENVTGYVSIFEITSNTNTNYYRVEERVFNSNFVNAIFEVDLTNTNLSDAYTNICLKEQTVKQVGSSENVSNVITLRDSEGTNIGMVYLQTNSSGLINCLQISNLMFDGSATNGTNYLYLSTNESYSEGNSYLVQERPLDNNYLDTNFKIRLNTNLSENFSNGGIVFIENETRTDATTSNEAPSLIGRTFVLQSFSYNVMGSVRIVDSNTIEIIDFSDAAPGTGIYLVTSDEDNLRNDKKNSLVNRGVRLIGYGDGSSSDAPHGNSTVTLDFDITTSTHTHVGVFCVRFGNLFMGQTAKFR